MKITNLGQNPNLPYKLGNIIYHFERYVNSWPLEYENSDIDSFAKLISEQGLEQFIISQGPDNLLKSVLDNIFEYEMWTEISSGMDYTKSERNMLGTFFASFKAPYDNNSKEYQHFFNELLQENLDDLIVEDDEGKSVSQSALQLINNSQEITDNTIGKIISGYDCVIGMKVEFDDTNDNGFMVKNSGYIQDIVSNKRGVREYLLINGDNGLEKFSPQMGFRVLELPINNERNHDAGSKFETDSLDELMHYHEVMLSTTDNVGEFVYNIIKTLNDSAQTLNYSEKEKFDLIRWGITGIISDRLFTPSSDETDEMYDNTPNYNLDKNEFLNIYQAWIEHLDNVGFDFDSVSLVSEIYEIPDEESHDFVIDGFTITDQKLDKDNLHITGNFLTTIDGNEVSGEFGAWQEISKDTVVTQVEIIRIDDIYQKEYDKFEDFSVELDEFIRDYVDKDLWKEAEIEVSDDEVKVWLRDKIATDYQLDPDNEGYMGYLVTGKDLNDDPTDAKYFDALMDNQQQWEQWLNKNLGLTIEGSSSSDEIYFNEYLLYHVDAIYGKKHRNSLTADWAMNVWLVKDTNPEGDNFDGYWLVENEDNSNKFVLVYRIYDEENEENVDTDILDINTFKELRSIDSKIAEHSNGNNSNDEEVRNETKELLQNKVNENQNKVIYLWDNQNPLELIESDKDINDIQMPHELYGEDKRYFSSSYVLFIIDFKNKQVPKFEIYEVNIDEQEGIYKVSDWDKSVFEFNVESEEFNELEGYTDERAEFNTDDGWNCKNDLKNILLNNGVLNKEMSEDEFRTSELNKFLTIVGTSDVNAELHYPSEKMFYSSLISHNNLAIMFDKMNQEEDIKDSIEVMPFKSFDNNLPVTKERIMDDMASNGMGDNTPIDKYTLYLVLQPNDAIAEGKEITIKILLNADTHDFLDTWLEEDEDVAISEDNTNNSRDEIIESLIQEYSTKNFPNRKLDFYYYNSDSESSKIVPAKNIIEFLEMCKTDENFIDSIKFVGSYGLKSATPKYMEFNSFMNQIPDNIIGANNFDNFEDKMNVSLPLGNDVVRLEISFDAEIYHFLEEKFNFN